MKIGAYAIERDYSHYVAYASKTVYAVVGTATRGPVGVATVCTSAQDLVNKFGPLNVNCYALYAGQYFLSQSSKLYFVRAASDSAKASKATIKGLNNSEVDVADALVIEATEVGTYFDDYTITVADSTTEGKYTLTLKSKLSNTVDTIKDVS